MSRQQYGAIYDLISEGPIEGLVNSSASVYYNDTPLAGSTSLTAYGSKLFTGSVSGTSITAPSGTFSSDLVGRFVAVPKAAKTSTLASGVSAGATTITVSDAVILTSYVTARDDAAYPRYIRIAGAGPDGAEYGGRIVERISDTQAVITPAISTAVSSGANIFIDHVTSIQSVANSTNATLAVTANTAVTNVAVQLYAAAANVTLGKANFKDASVHFRAGSREQASAAIYGAPSDSRIYAPGSDVSWHSDFGGTAGSIIIDPLSVSGLGFSTEKAQEITKVKLSLEFPAGMMIVQKDGDLKTGFAEFQVLVKYKKTSTSTEQEVLVRGRSNPPSWPGGTERITGYDSKYHPNGTNGSIFVITGRTRGSFIREVEVDLTPFQPFYSWRIELKRVTPDISDDFVGSGKGDQGYNFQGLTKLKTVQAETNNKFSYPLSAYALVTFSAQDFSTPPTRGYHIRGKQIKVPTNYITREEINAAAPNTVEAKYTRNKTTGVDTGSYVTWDGTFRGDKSLAAINVNYKLVYTNNPAWIFYDILTNKEYGLGEWVSESDVDVYALYQIARYCDEMVPNGQGGLEPRFTCNVYFQSKQEAYKVLKDLASSFRGMMYWIDGQISPVQDRPKEPVYTFTQGNVIDGMFTYESTGSRARVNQVNVTWNNPEELYRQSVLTVDDFDSIVEDEKIVSKDVVAFGATSESQALRVGRWHLLTDQLETELVKFQTSINAGFLRPGDIINVQDAKADAIEFSGRVSSSSTTTSINLDRSVTLQAGETYNLYLLYPQPGCYLQQDSATINSVSLVRGDLILKDASNTAITTAEAAANLVDDSGNKVYTSFNKNTRLEKQQISTGAGATTSVTVSSAFSAAPESEVIWAISNINEYQRTDAVVRYRIMAIEEDQLNLYSIIASKYVYEKFDELERNYAKYVEPYKPNPTLDALVPAPTNLRAEVVPSAALDDEGTSTGLDVIVSWNEPLESFTDSGGTTSDIKYRFIDSYDIQHDINSVGMSEDYETVSAGAGTTSMVFRGVSAGTYTLRVRTRNIDAQTSEYTEITVTARASQQPGANFDRSAKLVLGGRINSFAAVGSANGIITIANTNYTFVSTSGKRLDVSNANTALQQIDFSSTANGSTSYWYFDYSSVGTVPWKVAEIHTDSTVQDSLGTATNFKYWKEQGAANNGLTLITGVVRTAIGSNQITGIGTSFTTDFAEGDLIKVSPNNTYSEVAGAEYFEVSRVANNTSMFVRTNATKLQTDKYGYKQTLKPDFINDNILASVANTSGTFSASFFTTNSGEQGEQGGQGEQGTQGTQGNQGLQGGPGLQGNPGFQGAQGVQGAQGGQGAQGDAGEQGDQGVQGAQGGQGAQGDAGDQGAQGVQGAQGGQGAQGDAGEQGDQGVQGAQGGQGAQGDAGEQGDQGVPGAQGGQGAQGTPGQQGSGGEQGAQGGAGAQGGTGLQGDVGDTVFIIYYNGTLNDNLNGNATVDRDNPPTAPDTNGGSTAVNQTNTRITDSSGTVTNWYREAAFLSGDYFYWAVGTGAAFDEIPQADWSVSAYLQGAQGERGNQGSQGVQGVQGSPGQQGNQGNPGNQGNQGAQGSQGNQGRQGDDGDQGAQGAQGSQGNQGRQGDDGDQGAQGSQGSQGNQGRQGDDGDQGAQGSQGSQGNQGRQGDDGDQGAQGVQGSQGNQGRQGDDGDQGDQGVQGSQGVQGIQGTPGSPGQQGAQGGTGVQGAQGEAGAAGATIAFDTSNATIPANATKEDIIEGVASDGVARSGDIYWNVKTDRVFQRGANSSTYTELAKVTAGGNIVFDGPNKRIIITD
jgi:predicted phage tail protein